MPLGVIFGGKQRASGMFLSVLRMLIAVSSDEKYRLQNTVPEVMISLQMRNLLEKCIEVTHPMVRWDHYCAVVQSNQLGRVHYRGILDYPCNIKIVMK